MASRKKSSARKRPKRTLAIDIGGIGIKMVQIDAEGRLTSPQVPFGNNGDLAEQKYLSQAEIDSASSLLDQASMT